MHLIVFRNRKREDIDAAAYAADAARMEELAALQPGFVSVKTFVAEDGEVVTLSLWDSEGEARAWGDHPEHARVQASGRAQYYAEYTLLSCPQPRVRTFKGT